MSEDLTEKEEFKPAFTPQGEDDPTTLREGEPTTYVTDPGRAEAMAYGGAKPDGTKYVYSGKYEEEMLVKNKAEYTNPNELRDPHTARQVVDILAQNIKNADYRSEKAGFFYDHGADLSNGNQGFRDQPMLSNLNNEFNAQYDRDTAAEKAREAAQKIVADAQRGVEQNHKAA